MRIDGHTYLGEGRYKKQTVEKILADMACSGIDRSVLAPIEEDITVYNREGNERLLAAKEAHPDKFYAFACANPWYGEQAEKTLRDAFCAGMDGVFFVSSVQGFSINDPIVDPLIAICEEFGKPAYFHTATPAFALPLQLTYLARRFPKVNFIMGHAGANDFVYDVPASMRGMHNIYLDTSLNYCESITGIVRDYPERVVFGSDSPRSPLAFELDKAERATDDPAVKDLVLGGNMLRILGGETA
ncbi:MAG: amidohydrolase family protein [Lachnospiraceae bacterium]|nr:amidohydrolase family protein [Lachnospiraceae bacterium]